MKRNTKKPAPAKGQRQTVHALAVETGFDPRTIRKRLVDAGLYPPAQHPRVQVLEAIRPAASDHDKGALERRRLKAQCEKLEHALAIERGDYIKTETVEGMLSELGATIMALLRQKLENEWPISCAGLESAQVRVRGKALVDDIAVRLQRAVEPWHRESDKPEGAK